MERECSARLVCAVLLMCAAKMSQKQCAILNFCGYLFKVTKGANDVVA